MTVQTMKDIWESGFGRTRAVSSGDLGHVMHAAFIAGGLSALHLISTEARAAMDADRDVIVAVGDALRRLGTELHGSLHGLQVNAAVNEAINKVKAQGL